MKKISYCIILYFLSISNLMAQNSDNTIWFKITPKIISDTTNNIVGRIYNNTDKYLTTGTYYSVEHLRDSIWEPINIIPDYVSFPGIAYNVESNEMFKDSYCLHRDFFHYSSGEYRLKKQLSFDLCKKFEIQEFQILISDTINEKQIDDWLISSFKVSPSNKQLKISILNHTGNEMEIDRYFDIQKLTKDGWHSIFRPSLRTRGRITATILPNESISVNFDLSKSKDSFKEGHYRIIKRVSYLAYANFTIN